MVLANWPQAIQTRTKNVSNLPAKWPEVTPIKTGNSYVGIEANRIWHQDRQRSVYTIHVTRRQHLQYCMYTRESLIISVRMHVNQNYKKSNSPVLKKISLWHVVLATAETKTRKDYMLQICRKQTASLNTLNINKLVASSYTLEVYKVITEYGKWFAYSITQFI